MDLNRAAAPASDPSNPAAIAAVLVASRQAADAVCDRWSLLVVLAALQGARRFSDLTECTGMGSRLLAVRLKSLEGIGMIISVPYSIRPLRHEYRLTPMGEALSEVMSQMLRWERNWDASALLTSTRALGCRACGDSLTARDIILKLSRAELQRAPQRLTSHRRSTIDSRVEGGKATPLGASLDIFGDKWGIEILLCAFFRVHRFNAFRQHTGIAANILSDRLARLTAHGVLACARSDAPGYRLTEKGVDLYGAIVAIQDWADVWLKDRYRSPVKLVHKACGQVFHPARSDTNVALTPPLRPLRQL